MKQDQTEEAELGRKEWSQNTGQETKTEFIKKKNPKQHHNLSFIHLKKEVFCTNMDYSLQTISQGTDVKLATRGHNQTLQE